MINSIVKLNDIEFRINAISVDINEPIYMGNKFLQGRRRSIRIDAQTTNDNYIKVANWVLSHGSKIDLIYNTVQLLGVFPIDYDFGHNHINVTFSVDCINGDMELFNLQKLRKEKLEKIGSKL